MKKLFLLLLPLFSNISAQTITHDYPKDYFHNPLDIPIVLAGNFGECRPGHFHSGLDIKTLGKENLAVHAAADGYISRIKIEKGGFGHALYITHPNGFTTLYAHLNDFIKPVQDYLRQQQYQQESWAVDLPLSPEQFPVKQGEQIAWSGNTGASTAPHLHFEIRETKTEHPVNEGLFGLQVNDTRAPVMYQLAIYDFRHSIYEQDPVLLTLKKTDDNYKPQKDTVIIHSDKCGIGIVTDDFMNGSDNTLAFYSAELFLDDSLQCKIILDNIGYEETRYINAYADYKTHEQKGFWVQCLFQLPGNHLNSIYQYLNTAQGNLSIDDNKTHIIKILLKDFSGNESRTLFYLKKEFATDTTKPCAQLFSPEKNNEIKLPALSLKLNQDALYDTVCMQITSRKDAQSFSQRYQVHYAYVPVHTYFELEIKPNKLIPFSLRSKIAIVYNDGKADDGKAAAQANNGWYKASVRNFGEYRLVADTIAPTIVSLNGKNNHLKDTKQLSFKATDDITSVKKFRAELDGSWLLFEPRGDIFNYIFDEHCGKGKHHLKITASDENNNTVILNYNFIR